MPFQFAMQQLLAGNDAVIGLLHSNPFPNNPPPYVRTAVYKYEIPIANDNNCGDQWWIISGPIALISTQTETLNFTTPT